VCEKLSSFTIIGSLSEFPRLSLAYQQDLAPAATKHFGVLHCNVCAGTLYKSFDAQALNTDFAAWN
jgi:hypothetical protein